MHRYGRYYAILSANIYSQLLFVYLIHAYYDHSNPKLKSIKLKILTQYFSVDILLASTEPPEEAPTKCITETIEVEVKCSVRYIDFEGRSDGESMLKILQQIKPREVILVRGEPKTTHKFAESIRK